MAISRPIKVDRFSASRLGLTKKEIFTESGVDGFPDPSAGVITLPSGVYKIMESITTANRFYIAPGSSVSVVFEDSRNNTLTYTGTNTLFTAESAVRLNFQNVNFVCSGTGAKFMDIDSAVLQIDAGIVTMAGSGETAIGDYANGSLAVRNFFLVGYKNGIAITSPAALLFSEAVMEGNLTGTGSLINICGATGTYSIIKSCSLKTGDNESAFYICPTIDEDVNIVFSPDSGTGAFFQSGTTGPIASFTDVSTSTTAATVTNDSGDALFTSNGHGLNVGETAVHTTFTETEYNGDHVVTEVTTNTYKVGLDYEADDSGLFATTTCQVNDVAHGRSNGETLSIFGTINFDGGYSVFNSLTDTFEITLGKAFPGSETTGNWDTSSLDQRSKYVDTHKNGAQQDSNNIGSAIAGGNTTATTITTQNVFVDLNLDGNLLEGTDIELWKLTSTTTGTLRYDGIIDTSLKFTADVSAVSAGGANTFKFRLLRSRAGGAFTELPSPDNLDIPVGIGAAVVTFPLTWPVRVEAGDVYKLNVANTEGTTNIVIDTIKISIRL